MNQNLRSSSLNFMRLTEFQYIPFFEVFFFPYIEFSIWFIYHETIPSLPSIFIFYFYFYTFATVFCQLIAFWIGEPEFTVKVEDCNPKISSCRFKFYFKDNTLHSINALWKISPPNWTNILWTCNMILGFLFCQCIHLFDNCVFPTVMTLQPRHSSWE